MTGETWSIVLAATFALACLASFIRSKPTPPKPKVDPPAEAALELLNREVRLLAARGL